MSDQYLVGYWYQSLSTHKVFNVQAKFKSLPDAQLYRDTFNKRMEKGGDSTRAIIIQVEDV